MVEIDGDIVSLFTQAMGESFTAFMPLMASIIGVFMGFAIANNLSYFIKKATPKKS